MILLKIGNASELVAAKLGQFLERLTPDQIDQSAVEEQVIKKMIESLSEEGLEGEITSLNGLEIRENEIIISESLKVKSHLTF